MNVVKKFSAVSTSRKIHLFLFLSILVSGFQTSYVESVRGVPSETLLENRLQKKKLLDLYTEIPTLGFRNMVANSVFLDFLQYFSDVSLQGSPEPHLSPDFFEVILDKDPFYRDYYLFLSGSTTLYSAQPRRTVEIMDKGLRLIKSSHILPDSFYIWRYRGTDELLFLNDSESAQKSFENAARWAERSDRPESKRLSIESSRTAKFLAQNPDSKDAQVSAWASVLSTAMDDNTRKKAIYHIQELGGSVHFLDDGRFQIESAQAEELKR